MARYGDSMGFNVSDPLDTGILNGSDSIGTVWLRWGEEWPWYLNTASDHTSGWKTSAWTAFQSKLATVHARSKRAIVVALSVPTSINASSNSGNNWKYWPTNGTGDTAFADYCVKLASYLDTSKDVLQLGNEINNVSNFNLGDQSASRIAATIKAAYDAVHAAYPSLTIYSPSLCPVGDTGDSHSMVVWGSSFISAQPTLVNAFAGKWTVHPYIWGGDIGAGGGINGSNDPAGTMGWNGHIQADDWRQALLTAGCTSPGLIITERGEPSTPAPDYTEAWQNSHALADFNVIDYRRAVGWYVGPEITHTLVDSSLAIDAGHEFGAFRADLTRKPLFSTIAARAAATVGTTGGGTGNFDAAVSFDVASSFNDPTTTVVVTPPVSGSEITFKIEIGVPPTSRTSPQAWVLGDPTRGKTDSTWKIGPDYEFIDVTGDCQSFTVDRTRDREFDAPNAGTASLVIRDDRTDLGSARRYDPSNTASIFYPNLVTRSKVRVSCDGVVLFTGDITNLDRQHGDYGKTTTVTFNGADCIQRLANTNISYTPEVGLHNNTKRISRILERAGYFTLPRNIQSGSYVYQVGHEETGSALDLINAVVFSERGFLYANPTDTLIMLTHDWLSSIPVALTIDDQSTGAAYFYSDLTEDNGLELLVNDITIDSIEGDVHPVYRKNDRSMTQYGQRSWPGGTVKSPLAFKDDRRTLASAVVNAFPDPVTRFKTVTIPTARFVATKRAVILGVDLGTKIRVKRTPIGSGSPATVSQDLIVVGVSHRGQPRNIETTWTLSPLL